MGGFRRAYPLEFRRQMVELVRAGRTPEVSTSSKAYNPPAGTRHWDTSLRWNMNGRERAIIGSTARSAAAGQPQRNALRCLIPRLDEEYSSISAYRPARGRACRCADS